MNNRTMNLEPKYCQIFFDTNRISMKYELKDISYKTKIDDIFINFTPSDTLINQTDEMFENLGEYKLKKEYEEVFVRDGAKRLYELVASVLEDR